MLFMLITYRFGDGAGVGYRHGTADVFQMLVALLLFFALDSLLGRVRPPRGPPPSAPVSANLPPRQPLEVAATLQPPEQDEAR